MVESGHVTPTAIPWHGRRITRFNDRVRTQANTKTAGAGWDLSRGMKVLMAGRAALAVADREFRIDSGE
jgi:hypothetical protein